MAEDSLQGLRVLVTRPAGRADALMASIAEHGGRAVHIPLLAVVPLNGQRDAEICATTAQRMRELASYRRVIAISANAVHFAMPWLKKIRPDLPPHIGWYGIGAATIAALAHYGIDAHGGGGAMTSEALLAADDLQNLQGERILILRGVGGREQLAGLLRARGAQVDYAECYRRTEPILSAGQRAQLQRMAFDAICVNSNETLQNLWHCLQPPARDLACGLVLIVPSERVAACARKLGFARVITAANAGTQATLAALMYARV